ncbi:MAG TPA: hypothetical protein VJO35_06100 [Terriglobales bacterium]|nr:hypothetical protein [Terriglobales bacterium]
MANNPLRLVVSRFPRYHALYGDPAQETLTGWLDTLECSHQVELFNFGLAEPSFGPEQGAKRHRCGACAQMAAMKKPPRSVKAELARIAKAS